MIKGRGKSKIKHFCNTCECLNITEEEQEKFYRETGRKPNHICETYRRRVIHNCIGRRHFKIFPCYECIKDNQKEYEEVIK